jgi:hypothetical protein
MLKSRHASVSAPQGMYPGLTAARASAGPGRNDTLARHAGTLAARARLARLAARPGFTSHHITFHRITSHHLAFHHTTSPSIMASPCHENHVTAHHENHVMGP